MNKYIFISFNRYEGDQSDVDQMFFDERELSKELFVEKSNEIFEQDLTIGQYEEYNNIKINNNILCHDCEEYSYMIIKIE